MARLHRQPNTPHDQPYASSQPGASFNGEAAQAASHPSTHPSFIRTSLKVTGPFLVVGACTAVALAAGNPVDSTGSSKVNSTISNGSSSLTIQQSTNNNGAAAKSSSNSTQPSPATPTNNVGHSYSVHADSTGKTQVTVDGQSVTVPANGNNQQVYTSPDGNTTISISTDTQNNGSSGSTSSNFSSTSISSNIWSTNDTSSNSDSGGSSLP